MTEVKKVKFEEKTYAIEVDGKTYTIFPRTAERERKNKAHDNNLESMSEFEANMQLLGILIGEDATQEMFNEGDNTNLDKLARVTSCALELYMAEFNRVQTEKLSKKLEEVNPLINQISEVGKTVDDLSRKADFKKFVNKKK